MMETSKTSEQVIDYHERTKHGFDGYAKGPATIDWEAQPDAFRRFEGSPQYELALQDEAGGPSYAHLFDHTALSIQPWSPANLSRLLQFSLGLATWKQYGASRWSLRCNPSSGNLHPTEAYLVLIGIEGFDNGLYHYRPDQHALELRCRYNRVEEVGRPLLLIGFTSVHWREAWKYGERAYRYCQLDLGHALAAVSLSATTLGYQATPMLEIGNQPLHRLLGLDRSDDFYPDEMEYADLLLAVHPANECPTEIIKPFLSAASDAEWHGRANRLDPQHHYDWPLIAEVTKATQRPPDQLDAFEPQRWPAPIPAAEHTLSQQSAAKLFQQRRSAQAFDPNGSISANDFFRLMDRLLPRADGPIWSTQTWPTRTHLVLFIHRVEGLSPGLYALARHEGAREGLKHQLRPDLLWQPVDQAPSHLPLYCLAQADARRAAQQLGCHQEIAGDSAFSLSMLAEFLPLIEEAPWRYNELYWEAGMIGQSLYLEAEAIGLRGTGIGCFFDDGVHEMLGIGDRALQAVYHFTLGVALHDARLASLPPYPNEFRPNAA